MNNTVLSQRTELNKELRRLGMGEGAAEELRAFQENHRTFPEPGERRVFILVRSPLLNSSYECAQV